MTRHEDDFPGGIPLKDLPQHMADRKPSNALNPKDVAATTRLDLSLFPQAAIAYGALAMVEGDLKYGGYNFREAGVQVSVYVAAAIRHIIKYYNGEELDSKTRVHHLGNGLACLAIIVDGIEQGNLNDDRPPKQDLAALFDRMEENVAHLQKIFPRRTPRYRAKGNPEVH